MICEICNSTDNVREVPIHVTEGGESYEDTMAVCAACEDGEDA